MEERLQLNVKHLQKQKLVLTQKMRQVFHVLQLPALELKEYVTSEIEQNPLYEIKNSAVGVKKNIEEMLLQKKQSLFEHLMEQAFEILNKDDIEIAKAIFSNLNSKGFIAIPSIELANFLQIKEEKFLEVLKKVQTFDPIGVCARNLQECFLIQLREQKKEDSILYKLVENYYEAFLHGKKNFLIKSLKISEQRLVEIINELKKLKLNPISDYEDEILPLLIPDICIRYENSWKIFINNSEIPTFFLDENLQNVNFEKEEKKYIQSCILKGKWLKSALENRKRILFKISLFIIKKQKNFLLGKAPLQPQNLKELATNLNMHPSSIARALANKYVDCPLGIFPLKTFFSSSISVSSKTAIDLLKKLIAEEDKKAPFSDDILCKKLIEKGINIARRTISKYRKKLLIPSAKNRKS